MFARLVLDSEVTKLSNIWPRGSSIPIFLWGGSFFVTKNLSVSNVQEMLLNVYIQTVKLLQNSDNSAPQDIYVVNTVRNICVCVCASSNSRTKFLKMSLGVKTAFKT